MGRSFLKVDEIKTKVISVCVQNSLSTNIFKEIGCCGAVTLFSVNSLLLLDLGTVNHHLCASVSLASIVFLWFSNI